MILKRLGVHWGLLAVASAVAFAASYDPKDDKAPLEVQLWSVEPEAVKRVLYKSVKREVELAPQRDEQGRYLVGTVTKITETEKPPAQAQEADGGVKTVVALAAPEQPPKRETERFVGVKEAAELLESIAHFKAVRRLGVVAEAKLTDFGLTGEELAELTIDVEGQTHSFTVGGRTPGGGDVYVLDKASGEVYVVSGDVTKDVELADNRLMERELFTPPEGAEVANVVLSQGDKSRTIVHSDEHPSFWTDDKAPAEKDETLTNWMKKFERLRATSYVEGDAPGVEPLVTALFRSPKGEILGRIELAKQAVEGEPQPRYLARSPQTRWWTVVLSSTGSELAADLPSVLE